MAERADLLRAGLARAALLALLWAVLTGFSPDGMVVGGVSVLAAVLASLAQVPPRTVMLRPGAVLRFIPYFLYQSLRGGLDVSLRVLRPSLPLRPAIVVLPVGLPEGPARVLLASATSLMPGTLAVRIADDGLHVHVLDDRQEVAASIAELERRIAGMLR